MKMSSKSKSFDERSQASNWVAALSTSSRSASDNEMSKLAVRACGTSCTLGVLEGEVGDFEWVVGEEEPFLSTVDDRPDFESVGRGLVVWESNVVFWKTAIAEGLKERMLSSKVQAMERFRGKPAIMYQSPGL